ncbi:MAG: SRPBCC family protein [Gemmatimonadales bacterium]
MRSFATKITIAAGPQAIWKLLTDGPGYPDWNSTVRGVDGTIALNEKITVRVSATPSRSFPVRVVEFVPGSRMVWRGGLPLGLFAGTRTYQLKPLAGGQVEFTMREEYTGPLAPLITKSIPDLQPAFDEFAACLKARSERSG